MLQLENVGECNRMLSKGELTRIIVSYEEEARRVRIMNSLFKALAYVLIRLCTDNLDI